MTAPSMVVSTNKASCSRSSESGSLAPASARHCSMTARQPVKFSANNCACSRMTVGKLKCEVSDRAAALKIRRHKSVPIAVENTENTFDRVGHPLKDRVYDHRPQVFAIPIQDSQKQVLLRRERSNRGCRYPHRPP